MSLQSVKAFYERLASDETFRTQLQGVESKDQCSQFVQNAGYDFTTQEFEEYTAQLLESNSDNDEIKDLNEKELEAVFGGASSTSTVGIPTMQPMYGVIWPPLPMYGIPQIDLDIKPDLLA